MHKNVLWFVFLVPVRDQLGQLLQLLAIVALNLCSPSKNVLELGDYALLKFQAVVQALELITKLHTNV